MDSTGLPLSQIPEWSSDQVAKWFESVHLETYANSVREKNLTGKQLIDLDTGKLKVGVYVMMGLHVNQLTTINSIYNVDL